MAYYLHSIGSNSFAFLICVTELYPNKGIVNSEMGKFGALEA